MNSLDNLSENEYQMPCRCNNCMDLIWKKFQKGTKVHQGTLNLVKCSNCGVRGQLSKTVWNGVTYVTI